MVAVVEYTEPLMLRQEQDVLYKDVIVATDSDKMNDKDDGIDVEQDDDDLKMVDEDVMTPKSSHGQVCFVYSRFILTFLFALLLFGFKHE